MDICLFLLFNIYVGKIHIFMEMLYRVVMDVRVNGQLIAFLTDVIFLFVFSKDFRNE